MTLRAESIIGSASQRRAVTATIFYLAIFVSCQIGSGSIINSFQVKPSHLSEKQCR